MLTSPEYAKWMYIVYSCFFGFAMAGINSGFFNLVYDYVRPQDRAVAIGVKAAVGGSIGFASTLVAGGILNAIQENNGFNFFGANLYAQQLLSFVSLCITF